MVRSNRRRIKGGGYNNKWGKVYDTIKGDTAATIKLRNAMFSESFKNNLEKMHNVYKGNQRTFPLLQLLNLSDTEKSKTINIDLRNAFLAMKNDPAMKVELNDPETYVYMLDDKDMLMLTHSQYRDIRDNIIAAYNDHQDKRLDAKNEHGISYLSTISTTGGLTVRNNRASVKFSEIADEIGKVSFPRVLATEDYKSAMILGYKLYIWSKEVTHILHIYMDNLQNFRQFIKVADYLKTITSFKDFDHEDPFSGFDRTEKQLDKERRRQGALGGKKKKRRNNKSKKKRRTNKSKKKKRNNKSKKKKRRTNRTKRR